MKYQDDPNWWTHSLLREGYGKDKQVLLGLPTQTAALRQRGRTPAASRRLPGQRQRQVPPTATRPPSFDIQAESGVPLSVFQLSGPAVPASPEVRHPYPSPCHGAAHQELGALQGPASALAGTRFEEQHTLRTTRLQSQTPPCAWR